MNAVRGLVGVFVWAVVATGCAASSSDDSGTAEGNATATDAPATRYWLANCELSRDGKPTNGYLNGTFGIKEGVIKDGAQFEKDTVAHISENFPGRNEHQLIVRGGTVLDAEKQIFQIQGRNSG